MSFVYVRYLSSRTAHGHTAPLSDSLGGHTPPMPSPPHSTTTGSTAEYSRVHVAYDVEHNGLQSSVWVWVTNLIAVKITSHFPWPCYKTCTAIFSHLTYSQSSTAALINALLIVHSGSVRVLSPKAGPCGCLSHLLLCCILKVLAIEPQNKESYDSTLSLSFYDIGSFTISSFQMISTNYP